MCKAAVATSVMYAVEKEVQNVLVPYSWDTRLIIEIRNGCQEHRNPLSLEG